MSNSVQNVLENMPVNGDIGTPFATVPNMRTIVAILSMVCASDTRNILIMTNYSGYTEYAGRIDNEALID